MCRQVEAVTLSLSLQPHDPYSDLHTHTQLIYRTHMHTRTHTLTELTLRLGVWVWSTVNLMRIVNCRSLGKDSL